MRQIVKKMASIYRNANSWQEVVEEINNDGFVAIVERNVYAGIGLYVVKGFIRTLEICVFKEDGKEPVCVWISIPLFILEEYIAADMEAARKEVDDFLDLEQGFFAGMAKFMTKWFVFKFKVELNF